MKPYTERISVQYTEAQYDGFQLAELNRGTIKANLNGSQHTIVVHTTHGNGRSVGQGGAILPQLYYNNS